MIAKCSSVGRAFHLADLCSGLTQLAPCDWIWVTSTPAMYNLWSAPANDLMLAVPSHVEPRAWRCRRATCFVDLITAVAGYEIPRPRTKHLLPWRITWSQLHSCSDLTKNVRTEENRQNDDTQQAPEQCCTINLQPRSRPVHGLYAVPNAIQHLGLTYSTSISSRIFSFPVLNPHVERFGRSRHEARPAKTSSPTRHASPRRSISQPRG